MADIVGSLILLGTGLFVFVLLATVYIAANRYKLAPSDKILVVYGNVKGSGAAACYHGGGRIVWPLIQSYAMLDLKPLTININLEHALSQQNIRINVPSTFTIGISTEPSIMQNAAERLLNLPPNQIEDMAKEIIFGQLRLTVASLTIEEINQDREAFLSLVANNVDTELHKIGLYLINVNITDITDEADYIKSIGAKAAAEAIAAADVDRANATRQGAVGQAVADREREIEVAKNQAASEKGQKSAESDRRIFVQQQEAQAVEGENISRADIASYNADLAEREASAYQRSEVAKRVAQVEIEKAQYEFEGQRLRAEEIAREEVSKQQIEIAAEAEAERQRRIARGLADATLAAYNAEAEGQRAVLEAKAEGYAKLVESAGGDAKAAATLLMVEKIEDLVARQTEAIANLKIDKITVWDSGNNGEGGGSTSNFVSSLMQSLPPVHDVAKMAGVDLPDYLGSMKEE
ncbi:MAG: flotillin [Euryarchaeota archaeon]|nr:flotillin [Euryarchaeota archaeon]|tara:strand:- start:23587 stop:24981 length:1395 start_codon:yes stop_codon:yes gene_type:complete